MEEVHEGVLEDLEGSRGYLQRMGTSAEHLTALISNRSPDLDPIRIRGPELGKAILCLEWVQEGNTKEGTGVSP